MKKYDYLIVGAGLFGAVFAHEATRRGKTCLVIDKRGHIGGNIYTEEVWKKDVKPIVDMLEKQSRYTDTVHIFSILPENRCGIISISLQNLIIL